MGNFWSWKTFWTFLEVSKLDKTKNLIIANVPYRFVDLFYSKAEELYTIIESLEKRVYETNNDVENYYYSMKNYKNIVLIVDEAHLYFNSRKRDKSWLMDRLDVILTQCRKRNIKIFFISQRLKRVDLNIRRMTDYVVRYKRQWIPILWTQRSIRTVYENAWDLADIQGDESKTYVMNSDWSTKSDIENSVIESDMFRPMFKVLWLPIGKRLSSRDLQNFEWEAHNSYFISGLPAENTNTVVDQKKLSVEERPLSEKEKKIKDRIEKNLPTIKALYQKFKNGSNSATTTWDNQGSDACDTSDNAELTTRDNRVSIEYPVINDEIQDWKRSYTTRRFNDLRELRDSWDSENDLRIEQWTNSNTRTKVRIKRTA